VLIRCASFGFALLVELPLAILLALDVTTPDLWKETQVPRVEEVAHVDLSPSDATSDRIVTLETLATADGDKIDVAVSRPSGDDRRYPVMILIGGFDTGRHIVDHVTDPGANVVIGYGYPDIGLLKAGNRPTILRLFTAQRDAHRVPAQIAELATWAVSQPWVDRDRISLVGVSLGAVLAPAAAHAMNAAGVSPSAVVLADGGAGIASMIEVNLRHVTGFWRGPAAWLLGTALRRIAPERHLSYLRGNLLLVHASSDRFISPAAAALLDHLAPNPKTVVTLPGDHVGPGEPAVMAILIATVRGWLLKVGAIN
jgi:dienelactone hydrolase